MEYTINELERNKLLKEMSWHEYSDDWDLNVSDKELDRIEKLIGVETKSILTHTEKKLKSIIMKSLDDNYEKIIKLLEEQYQEEPIIEIKGIDDLGKMIKNMFTLYSAKELSDKFIKDEFDDGWTDTEKRIDQNIPYNAKALEFLQDYTFENIKGMTEEISNDLRQELERGIIDGEGITKLKARVKKVFNVGDNRASMIARTETNRANNQGKLLGMKNSGIEDEYVKKWSTHKDDRTSAICKGLDGQIVGINEEFHYKDWSGQAPPSHVNCRSTFFLVKKDEEND